MLNKVLLTGGCGFIGSHLVDSLVQRDFHVTVIDDLSANTDVEYLKKHIEMGSVEFIQKDIRNYDTFRNLESSYDTIFHLAAQPDVKISVEKPRQDFEVNVVGTFNVLEYMREKSITKLVFASSVGTVYGESDFYPTPENFRLRPISNYGAAKAAAEMYCSSYSSLYDLDIVSLRLGNIYGPRSTHGVMFDFYQKLKKDSSKLAILGDGSQSKSYLYISDTIKAFELTYDNMKKGFEAFNVSSDKNTTVTEIADFIVYTMELEKVDYSFTGGKGGWKGDVTNVSVDTSKLKTLGWKAKISDLEGIRKYIEWLESKNQ